MYCSWANYVKNELDWGLQWHTNVELSNGDAVRTNSGGWEEKAAISLWRQYMKNFTSKMVDIPDVTREFCLSLRE